MKILVCGAGISGTALAFWLSKQTHQHTITVLERFPTLRTSGLQIDLRGPGIQVLRRMGLERAFREKAVAEQGLQVVDKRGRRWGYFPANRSGKGLQSFTTEFEIMRGDLCGLLFEACGGQTVNQIVSQSEKSGKSEKGVRFVFGVYVVRVTQVEGGVEVVFSDGKRGLFDLVVGADGLGSRMRRMMFGVEGEGEDANPGYHSLGAYAGYCTIRQDMRAGEGYDATAFITTGARGIMTRRHEPERYQAYVFCESSASKRLGNASKGDIEEEKIALAEVFRGAGWESDSILQGLVQSDDFYCERIGVIKLDNWSQGRIALLGDAAYGPSAMTGMGTSCAMAGAYILAGEIGKGSSEGDITTALKNYEQKMRPFIDQVQKGLTDDDNYMGRFPTSSFGITLVYCLVWVASIMRLDILARWVLREDTKDWELPEYPDMDGSS